jgi:hypothetical protein
MGLAKFATPLILCAFRTLLPPMRQSDARTQGLPSIMHVTPCDLSAYVIDQAPNGLNVCNGSGSTSKVVGKLLKGGAE